MLSDAHAARAPDRATVTLERMATAHAYNAWLLERGAAFLGDRVLDAGAGVGTFTELLTASGKEVVALEPDPQYVARLERRFAGRDAVTVVEGDATSVDLDRESFDSIVCFNVLEHIRDDAAALTRFRAALRPGGHLLLLVPAHPFLYGAVDGVVEHERRYRRNDLSTLLVGAGFHVAQLRHVNPVGAIGWLATSRVLRRETLPAGPIRLYDRLVPVFRALDRLPLPFGLSLWAVARRA